MDESNGLATLPDPGRIWTFDDLDALPDGIDRRRFEIVEGSLLVSPTPGSIHELLITRLRDRLRSAFPHEVDLVTTLGVDIGDKTSGGWRSIHPSPSPHTNYARTPTSR